MPLTPKKRERIEKIIKKSLRDKFKNYNPETSQMPFHFRLLGRDRMALFSFIQSLNTTFGMSVFEPVAETLAGLHFGATNAKKQYDVGASISKKAQYEIQDIIDGLSMGEDPDKPKEIERIRRVCDKGEMSIIKSVNADLFIREHNGSVHLFELKTAKPNIPGFKDFKRTLLEWIAIYLAKYPSAKINSYIAIPYNPYEPKPYERWTMKGMLHLKHELKVGKEFWNFLGGGNIYDELLDCFERVGIELKPEIDDRFARFK